MVERVYRRQAPAWKPALLIGLMFAAGTAEVLISGLRGWVAAFLIAMLLAADGFFALTLLRARTVVRASGITAYGALRVRKWSWPEIRELRVETVQRAQGAGPGQIVHLYDTAGRRTTLPFLNDRVLPHLHAEVEILHGMLAGRRGVA
ncbi:PH domain-containing protein [Streptomyces sp. S.PB5]|uniref:PH domain-containing protein n=1 Tax=Streptomyces sp. S.PB5 TaxID=3020844 RepID=UPI0025B22ADE|nr:PH domain-containing protein [Streptomyces sp. S.PB5]MDN3028786.1 PH domain-containing protein [Streptomyces sp. S.PB5]